MTYGLTMDIDDMMHADVFDGRDVEKRIEELIDDRDIWIDEHETAHEDDDPPDTTNWIEKYAEEFPEEAREISDLEAFREGAEGYSGDTFRDGVTLIADSYFEEYAEQFADDIGAINRDANWPLNHIDWKAAAEELQQDYTEVDLRGMSFWVR